MTTDYERGAQKPDVLERFTELVKARKDEKYSNECNFDYDDYLACAIEALQGTDYQSGWRDAMEKAAKVADEMYAGQGSSLRNYAHAGSRIADAIRALAPADEGTVRVPRELVRVLADACDIADDWDLTDVQVKPPKDWNLKSYTESAEDGWVSTCELAKFARAMIAQGEK